MKKTLNIVHAPLEIAGQVGLICDFLRQFGMQAVGYNYYPTYLNYQRVINTDSYELAKMVEFAIEHYDLFHFHNGYTFLENFLDIEMIRKRGKHIIMHHRGNDVRSRQRSRKWKNYENPYVNAESSVPDDEMDRNLRYFAKNVSAAIVQDHELMPYVEDYYAEQGKKVYILPRLINLRSFEPAYEPETNRTKKVLIVHAPTQRDFKGTEFINAAIEQLQAELPIEYQLVEGMSHHEAFQLYRKADIIIDQILCGAYGNLSVEGMALGKPVVCYIRPDLVDKYPPGLPIRSAHPDNLRDVLRELVSDHELRRSLGIQGRQYVEQNHAADRVIRQLLDIYREVLGEGYDI